MNNLEPEQFDTVIAMLKTEFQLGYQAGQEAVFDDMERFAQRQKDKESQMTLLLIVEMLRRKMGGSK